MNEQESNQQTHGQNNGQNADEQAANARAKAAEANYQPGYDNPGRRRSSEDRANAFNTLAWMMEGATGLVEELRHSDLGLSEQFWVHLYAMRREGLLAARAAIDSLLSQTEKESIEAQEQSQRQARRGEVAIE
jgi:hypothetical protein